MQENNIECICFDFGGVLVKINYSWSEVVKNISLDTEVSDDPYYALEKSDWRKEYDKGITKRDVYLNTASSVYNLSIPKLQEAHMSILVDKIEGTDEIIQKLKDKKVKVTGLSNTNELHWEVLSDKKRYPNISLLDSKVLSFECGMVKPNPKIYSHAERVFNVHPQKILYFDDIADYVDAAEYAGWNARWINPDKDVPAQMIKHLKDFQIDLA